jgi:hypothetical protein
MSFLVLVKSNPRGLWQLGSSVQPVDAGDSAEEAVPPEGRGKLRKVRAEQLEFPVLDLGVLTGARNKRIPHQSQQLAKQQPDDETMLAVVLGGAELRERKA